MIYFDTIRLQTHVNAIRINKMKYIPQSSSDHVAVQSSAQQCQPAGVKEQHG